MKKITLVNLPILFFMLCSIWSTAQRSTIETKSTRDVLTTEEIEAQTLPISELSKDEDFRNYIKNMTLFVQSINPNGLAPHKSDNFTVVK